MSPVTRAEFDQLARRVAYLEGRLQARAANQDTNDRWSERFDRVDEALAAIARHLGMES